MLNGISDLDYATYSDLFKDVYGYRPRNVTFDSVEEFDADFQYLVRKLNEQLEEEREHQARSWDAFIARLDEIRDIVHDCSWEHAIEILADAEDQLDDIKVYGYESLEYHLNLEYDSIKKFLASVEN